MIQTTIEKLLSDPVAFDGKVVEIIGYYIAEREHTAIYQSDTLLSRDRGIWLRGQESAAGGRAKANKLNQQKVKIIVVFSNRRRSGTGHFNLSTAQITNITHFGPVEGE